MDAGLYGRIQAQAAFPGTRRSETSREETEGCPLQTAQVVRMKGFRNPVRAHAMRLHAPAEREFHPDDEPRNLTN